MFLFLSPTTAHAWGHVDFIGTDWRNSTLTYALLSRNMIRYCVDVVHKNRFPPVHISLQVKEAIQVWLSATNSYKNALVLEVPCRQKEADLVVQVGPESEFTEMSGYQVPQLDGNRYYSFVKLNSDYIYTEGKEQFRVIDFAQMIPLIPPQMKVMEEISLRKKMNVGDFSEKYKIHYQKAYLNTYKMLLHEIGHAFGLCDTEEELFQYCDMKFRTQDRPPAVMNQADFFYLTADDKAGLDSLFERFRANSKKSY